MLRLASLCLVAIVCLSDTAVIHAQSGDRSPVDVAITPDDRFAVVANETADSLSLVDLTAGKVVDEAPVGHRPAYVALVPQTNRVLVTSAHGGELHAFTLAENKLKPLGKLALSGEPTGIAVTSDGKTAYVALAAAASVAVVDLVELIETSRIGVGRWPRYLTLSPDNTRLAVGNNGDLNVSVVDTVTRKLLYDEDTGGINMGHMIPSADGKYAYLPWMVYRNNPINPGNIKLGWVLGTRIGRVRLDGSARREAITLDPPGKAVADPHGIAMTRDGEWLVASASGTHELLVYQMKSLKFMAFGGPGDHIERDLLANPQKFYRVPLGGRPMGVRLLNDDRRVLVSNWLDNSLQVVDLAERKVTQTITLGGSSTPSLARRGAAIFYDGERSLDQWYSCHSCHYHGGGNAVAMDTRNDKSDKTFKTVPSLVNLTHTGPWTWHGWQSDLQDAMLTSLKETMQGPGGTSADAAAMIAYFASLEPSPSQVSARDAEQAAAVARGKAVFHSSTAGCANCHSGPYFTDGKIHDVGLAGVSDVLKGYNTPSLIGVGHKVRWLHDGRSKSLDDVLTGPHNPANVTGNGELSPDQRRDLIAYLNSL
ncbi:MAG: c-type cytochrome [Planctomycetaceae bacterium]|nr:c-type cytochrome [Planctomycetaceae bacterium]